MPEIELLCVEHDGKIWNYKDLHKTFLYRIGYATKEHLVKIESVKIDFSIDFGETNYELY